MSAGTITLTNGSAVVGGSGTSFTTELAAGDFIVSTVGGVSYTLPVKSVESNAQLTLVSNFTGPTQAGAAWSAVPRVALNMVTAALVAQSAEALRGLNYDKQNWQSIFSGTGNVTVTLPDGTTWTGPAWNSITTSLSGKAAKGANSDITSLSGLTTALSLAQGGTGSTTASGARTNIGLGNSATRDVGTAAGTVAAGDDLRLGTVNGKSGGTLTTPSLFTSAYSPNAGNKVGMQSFDTGTIGGVIGRTSFQYFNDAGYIGARRGGSTNIQDMAIGIDKANGTWVTWIFSEGGNATANNGSWVNNSDGRIKTNIRQIESPLEKMKMLRGYTWERLDNAPPGQGFIAQELMEVIPTAVFTGGTTILDDGTEIKDTLSVDVAGAAAALHHEAILALMEQVEDLKKKLDSFQSGS
ncbi:tail fiber domain-containing protein [Enterobacter asburiae]|uniref:tail fiber domain-containing protein n=1 Tax=Enterobacter asburiae TaxID=61645 RepID=UPI002966804B|nr:tail fiber domain-containing protein [Enterobacter asburiae]MDW3570955.1 tail fiber domain-containing protein [Enterobacter asburiae]